MNGPGIVQQRAGRLGGCHVPCIESRVKTEAFRSKASTNSTKTWSSPAKIRSAGVALSHFTTLPRKTAVGHGHPAPSS